MIRKPPRNWTLGLMELRRAWLNLAFLLLIGAATASAQEPIPPASGSSASTTRPGRFRLGPFYLSPTFRLGTIGIDTNVFYTPTDRQTDFTASGGPGLRIALPMGSVQLTTEGGINYIFFARTESQRKLAGGGRARLEWNGARLTLGVEEVYARTFERPSFEVDERVLRDQWATKADLSVKTIGRLRLRTEASAQRIDVAAGQEFLGSDLRRAFTRDEYKAVFGFDLGVTVKTSLLLEGDYQLDRFDFETSRDADSNRIYGGFKVDSETRLSGRAVGGVRLYRPRLGDRLSGPEKRFPYADVDLSYRVGRKLLLNGSYHRDIQYSAFATTGATPTIETEVAGGRIEQALWRGLNIHFFGRVTRFVSDGEVRIIRTEGDEQVAVRDDTVWEGGADLGYLFRSRIRVGVAATYTERNSTFADFGIQGFLVGATVRYVP
jgi:hypothetical protein